MAKNLAKLYLCSSVLWRVKLAIYKIGYLAEGISKQNVEGGAWFLLIDYSKMWEGNEFVKQKVIST